ncbi:DUF6134 family protein [Aquimarina algicola]|uniref:DUF3108 domain-containing protein n=1 Tax=Aquimarina algicola TaxID=2589995 RepID=A0A504JHB9_9FLAO|nr:DUF6134 family protein [Aquimarina algicola]TPN87083.1 hypothetical protein FHK87_05695 [Aquimarina algicola]
MNQKQYISLLMLLIASLSISAQTNTYDILSKKDTLGILKVSKLKEGENLIYNYHVDMKVKLLVNIHMKYTINAKYDRNQLNYASVNNFINGKSHHSSSIKWLDSTYVITTKNKKQQKLNEKISYSGIRLFFDEPTDVKKVFSEYTGHNGSINKINTDIYELTLHNGKKNKYFYDNGELVKANIHNSLIHFDLVLRR